MTTDTIQTKIDALRAELATLTAAVESLQAQRADTDAQLDALFADAERSATPAAKKAAADAERAHGEIDAQLRRKRAAVVATERDIATSLAELEQAQRAAVVGELLTVHAAYAEAAYDLDENLANVEAWGRLHQLAKEGNALWRRIRQHGGRPQLFTMPSQVRDRLLASLGAKIDAACDLRRGGDDTLLPSDQLEVASAGGLLRSL